MKLLAPAKINLALDVLKKNPLGYHEIQTVYHEIPELADEIEILECEKSVHGNTLVEKTINFLKTRYKIDKSVQIKIKQNIPRASGLGGASSDAAAILKGLNKLWNLNLSIQKLMSLAAELGMDVPFFIVGGTALGTHFGEKITPLKPVTIKFKINPATSNIPEKTKQAYSALDLSLCGKNTKKTKALLKAIRNSDNQAIIENLHNDFETLGSVAKNEHLSGAGPSTFTII